MKTQETREEESDELEETETEELDAGSMSETFKRSFEAWYVAERALMEDPRMFGAQSFSLIALGMMLEIVKASRRR